MKRPAGAVYRLFGHGPPRPSRGERRVWIGQDAKRAKDDQYRQLTEAQEHKQPAANPPASRLLDTRIGERPGWTEPPVNWRGPWSGYEKEHYWACEPEAGA